jgi:hypothetical protein
MEKTKAKKQSHKESLAEVAKELAESRVAASAIGVEMTSAVDPMELLWEKVKEELAAPSRTNTGMSLTPNLNTCLKTLGFRATLIT